MAELIDKGALKEMFPCNGEGSWTYNVTAKAYIDSLPTTTEAEIRAMAYERFAEKLCDVFSEEYGEVTVNGIKFDVLTLDGATEITWDVAEQLKEE